jgi:hypothetical protein
MIELGLNQRQSGSRTDKKLYINIVEFKGQGLSAVALIVLCQVT